MQARIMLPVISILHHEKNLKIQAIYQQIESYKIL